jgi:hypothetical protein
VSDELWDDYEAATRLTDGLHPQSDESRAAARKAIVDEVERAAVEPWRQFATEMVIALHGFHPTIGIDKCSVDRCVRWRALLNQQGNDPEWTEEDEWIAQHQQGNDRG